jgi:hypothetical protein
MTITSLLEPQLATWLCDEHFYHEHNKSWAYAKGKIKKGPHRATKAECAAYERQHDANGACDECRACARDILRGFGDIVRDALGCA